MNPSSSKPPKKKGAPGQGKAPLKQIKAILCSTYVISKLPRIFKFVCSCIRLRSIGAAIWLDAYDNAVGK